MGIAAGIALAQQAIQHIVLIVGSYVSSVGLVCEVAIKIVAIDAVGSAPISVANRSSLRICCCQEPRQCIIRKTPSSLSLPGAAILRGIEKIIQGIIRVAT